MEKEKLYTTISNGINALVIIGICAMSIYWAQMLWSISNSPATKLEIQYDCRLAEISVDYPSEVKRRCRELMLPKAYAKHE
jgi:hypothetical protein